jgi:Ca2+/Na+ antiporter
MAIVLQGVTLLAIGNGAPDIFASFTATVHGAPSMGISSVLGYGGV